MRAFPSVATSAWVNLTDDSFQQIEKVRRLHLLRISQQHYRRWISRVIKSTLSVLHMPNKVLQPLIASCARCA